MADWYVYQSDGDPLGPWSTDAIAEAILAGSLAPDVWVAAPGGPRWLRALDVPVIGRLVEGIPTRPRRDSGLRMMPSQPSDERATAVLAPITRASGPGETAPMTAITMTGDDLLGAWKADYDRAHTDGSSRADDPPSTDPVMPPSATTPAPPTYRDLGEAPSTDRRHTRKGA